MHLYFRPRQQKTSIQTFFGSLSQQLEMVGYMIALSHDIKIVAKAQIHVICEK